MGRTLSRTVRFAVLQSKSSISATREMLNEETCQLSSQLGSARLGIYPRSWGSRGVLLSDMSALRRSVVADEDRQHRRSPHEENLREATSDHLPLRGPAAAMTCVIDFLDSAHGRSGTRTAGRYQGNVEDFRRGGVRTPIVERPRTLQAQRRASRCLHSRLQRASSAHQQHGSPS